MGAQCHWGQLGRSICLDRQTLFDDMCHCINDLMSQEENLSYRPGMATAATDNSPEKMTIVVKDERRGPRHLIGVGFSDPFQLSNKPYLKQTFFLHGSSMSTTSHSDGDSP